MEITGRPHQLTFHFNPSGILPGQGARTLSVLVDGPADAPRIERAQLSGSTINGLPVPTRRYRSGTGSEQVRAAVAALELALPRLVAGFEAGPSDPYHVDEGWGWARGGTFALHNGPVGFVGTESYVGSLKGDARPVVHEAVELLGSFAEALRGRSR